MIWHSNPKGKGLAKIGILFCLDNKHCTTQRAVLSTPSLRKLRLFDFWCILARIVRTLCLICIKTIPRLEGAEPWPSFFAFFAAGNRRPSAPFFPRAARPRPGLRGPLPGPPALAPVLVRCRPAPGSALRLRPALRPKSNKKGVWFKTSIEQNGFCCSVLGWPGVAPAGGGPPAVRPSRPLCAPGALPRSRLVPASPPGGSVLPYGAG